MVGFDPWVSASKSIGIFAKANALCEGIAPEVFRVDDDDNLQVLVDEIDPSLAEKLREAERACPRQAIRLIES